jgi:hypothetical protein
MVERGYTAAGIVVQQGIQPATALVADASGRPTLPGL